MNKLWRSFIGVVLISVIGLSSALAETPTPVGTWQTIDETTNKPHSTIQISLDEKGKLIGKIIAINFRPDEGPDDVCSQCTDERHNQKIIGLVILTGMKQSQTNPLYWSGGKVLDPSTGKVFKCHIMVGKDNKTLNVRGYIGISLIGRTQTWIRKE